MTNTMLATHGLLLVLVPALTGTLCAFLPRRAAALARVLMLAALAAAAIDAVVFWAVPVATSPAWLHLDALARMMCAAASIMAFLVALYSCAPEWRATLTPSYCAAVAWTVSLANVTFCCNHLLALLVVWGALGIPLFLLVNESGTEAATAAAKKALIMIGGVDSLLILGAALLCVARGDDWFTARLVATPITAQGALALWAFVGMVAAALTKAGAVPLHTWVPDVAETAPVPVTALLPAALDKLLGIYLLLRIVRDVITPTPVLQTILLALGAATILLGVFMALVQHDLLRLLGYHAVSQVGYMVLGIATLTPLGILAGLFHLLNNVVYKTLLFLGAGAVQRRVGTTDLDRIGGLARRMPATFVCMLIGALAISGVPPLNGFASKWLVYQGVIQLGPHGGGWIIWLVAAMFGSALTLASFMKVMHAVFLARAPGADGERAGVTDAGWLAVAPMALLALACVVLGVAAWAGPVHLLARVAGTEASLLRYMRPVLVTALLAIGLLAGLAMYALSMLNVRRDSAHIGGEPLADEMNLSGTDFYETIANLPVLRTLYLLAAHGWCDVYQLGLRLTTYVSGLLRAAHQGQLHAYVTWCVVAVTLLIMLLCAGRL